MLDGISYFTTSKADLSTIERILRSEGYITQIAKIPDDDLQLTFSFELEDHPNTRGYLRWYKCEKLELSQDEKHKLKELGIEPTTAFDVLYRKAWKKKTLQIMKIVLTQLGGCLLSEYSEDFYTLSNLDELERIL